MSRSALVDSNVIETDAYNGLCEKVCNKIYNRLAQHCGPLAKNALIIQHDENRMGGYSNIFTKDGADIVKNMEFDSLLETHIKNVLHYVGVRIDNISHDGTTTAMMLFADLLKEIPPRLRDYYTSHQISEIINYVCDTIIDGIENHANNTQSLAENHIVTEMEAKKFIAYHQAMVSSKGDTEVANAIVEVIEHLPVEMFGQFTLSQSSVETNKRVTVKYDDYDFSNAATTGSFNYNHKLSTEYLGESCTVLISENELIPGNPELMLLLEYISKMASGEIISDDDFVIITKKENSHLTNAAAMYNEKHKNKIVIFSIAAAVNYSGKELLLSAMLASAGKYPIMECFDDQGDIDLTKHLLHNVKIEYKYRRLYVSNLYKRDGDIYHPYFRDPEAFIPYTKIVHAIKDILDNYINGHVRVETAAVEAMLRDYIDIYRRLVCQRVVRLEVSGSTHDSLADHGIIKDSMGAVISSLEKGFVFDGLFRMIAIIKEVSVNSPHAHAAVFDVIQRSLVKILNIIHAVTYEEVEACTLSDESAFFFAPGLSKGNIIAYDDKLNVHGIDRNNMPITTVLIQPIAGYIELFKRIKELVPKFANTVCCITPGNINKDED